VIQLHGVRKAFHQGRPNEYWALNGIDLTLRPNQTTVFFGPSGSGKSTLLSLLGALARPTAGRIFLHDQEITSLPEHFLSALRRRTFGFVFQQFQLLPGLSVLDNVILPAYPLAPAWDELRARAEALLETLHLAHRRDARVDWLSGGEQQRVAIARALINDPEILIADEPTANLDSALSLDFLALLETLAAQGRTLLLSSHDPLVVESSLVARVVRLRDGRIVEDR